MRTMEEKAAEIRRREEDLRNRKFRRHTIGLSALSAAAAVLLVTFSLSMFPEIGDGGNAAGVSVRYASIFSANPAIGFALIVVLAFALGVCVTMLVLKVHRHNERSRRGNQQ